MPHPATDLAARTGTTPAEAPRDVLIVGAGPAGLALAAALDAAGFAVTVLERQSEAALRAPAADGRDIALTHRSVAILRELGLWARLDADAVAPIREARVSDPRAPSFLSFDPQGSGKDALGYLVPNHLIRRAAFEAVAARPTIRLECGVQVSSVRCGRGGVGEAVLDDGRRLTARLLVAADSRFSAMRRSMGIGAFMHDFGRSVIVCRLQHERPHDAVAHECFDYGRTLAILPMNAGEVSAVITAPADAARELMALPAEAYARSVQRQFNDRLGTMRLVGERHLYPLVAVYAHRFACEGGALVGDAAVGMHPVTAHGYNLGLYGVQSLAQVLQRAREAGRDIGSLAVLSAYEREHRLASGPIFAGTQALVRLFTDESAPAKALRGAVIAGARWLPPLRAAITRQLTGEAGRRSAAMRWA